MKRLTKSVDKIIIDKEYEGIRDQDGWETLELTVRWDYANNPEFAEKILKNLID